MHFWTLKLRIISKDTYISVPVKLHSQQFLNSNCWHVLSMLIKSYSFLHRLLDFLAVLSIFSSNFFRHTKLLLCTRTAAKLCFEKHTRSLWTCRSVCKLKLFIFDFPKCNQTSYVESISVISKTTETIP